MDTKQEDRLQFRYEILENKVSRILQILENDTAINQDGLVERVKKNEIKVADLELYNKINKAKSATYGTIAGFVVVVVWNLVKLVYHLFFEK